MPGALIHVFGTLRKGSNQKRNTKLRKTIFLGSTSGATSRATSGATSRATSGATMRLCDNATDTGDGPFEPP